MAEAPLIATPLADLDTQRPYRSPDEILGGAFFIPTSVKFFAVTALLWVGIIAGSVCAWVGAFKIGAMIAGWLV